MLNKDSNSQKKHLIFSDDAEFCNVDVEEVVDFSEYPLENLDKTVTSVVKLLKKERMTVATAESCTGGLLSAYLTSVDGASSVFECGVCTYANRMKQRLLQVPEDILERYGAVSGQTAAAMVHGLSGLSDADVCVSVTGIAGPQGGTPEKPVGTVYVGLLFHGKRMIYLLKLWYAGDGSRRFNREMTAAFVMGKLKKLLMEEDA
jgi:nicotinamide-nucleotide amidase